jgi:hypothetical protein
MANWAVGATLFAIVGLVSASTLAADCAADADEANAKCYSALQAAVDAALAADLPLVLPRGIYRITTALVIDYSRHAGTGFRTDRAQRDDSQLPNGSRLLAQQHDARLDRLAVGGDVRTPSVER